MGFIDGKNFFISVRNSEGTYFPVACDKSCTIAITRNTFKVCDPETLWRRTLPGGEIVASVNGNALVNYNKQISASFLQQTLISGTLLRMMCEVDTGDGAVLYEFNGYCTSISITGAVNDMVTYDYSIDITGAVQITDSAGKVEEVGIQNLLALSVDNGLLNINNAGDNLII